MKNKEQIAKIWDVLDSLNVDVLHNKQAIIKLENERESKPQLKQLDQGVFNGLDGKWKYAAVDKNGEAHLYIRHIIPDSDEFIYCEGFDFEYEKIGTDYDATDWKNSLIKRETNELTGSELCKAMLDRGDKYVLCLCWDSSYADIEQVVDIVSGFAFKQDKKAFVGVSHNWDYATPINNQGGPLTASDVDL